MSIELNGLSGGPNSTQKKESQQTREVSPRGDDGARVDRGEARAEREVELSQNAERLRRLESEVDRADAFDRERVERLAQAIAEQRYPVDSARIAEKFLDLEENLYR